MYIKYAVVILGLSGCAAQAEESWFQACGPVYPVRLEGPACESRASEGGIRGNHPTTGVAWCCVAQQLTREEKCAKDIKKFTEDSRLGKRPSAQRFALLQYDCANELADLSKRTGVKIPRYSQRRDVPQSERDRQPPPGGRRGPVIDPYLNEVLAYGIAIAAQAAIVYPVRPMKIDPGNSRINSGGPSHPSSQYPDVLRDAQRRPSGISGLGGGSRGGQQSVPVNHPVDQNANVPARSSMPPATAVRLGPQVPQSSKANGVIVNPEPVKVQEMSPDLKQKLLNLQMTN
ncbi:hypothetical protein [Methylobacterium aquaticum]|uniref:hypothetical protein n=1 Tax=Methylobacterium aquaticum TaxID=270351 RepID=UPI001931579F|nr:hypothetical protein [Methylobacterium aquaticum]QRE73645.1 hypothetical protein F1D61_08445 [Methylobacterium aquaticum]